MFKAVIDRILDFYLKANEIFYEATKGRLDAVLIGNDFGSQQGLMLSPDLIRSLVFPGTKKLIDQAPRLWAQGRPPFLRLDLRHRPGHSGSRRGRDPSDPGPRAQHGGRAPSAGLRREGFVLRRRRRPEPPRAGERRRGRRGSPQAHGYIPHGPHRQPEATRPSSPTSLPRTSRPYSRRSTGNADEGIRCLRRAPMTPRERVLSRDRASRAGPRAAGPRLHAELGHLGPGLLGPGARASLALGARLRRFPAPRLRRGAGARPARGLGPGRARCRRHRHRQGLQRQARGLD